MINDKENMNMTKTKEIKKTEERIYCLPGDSTLYKIRKINNYYTVFTKMEQPDSLLIVVSDILHVVKH